MFVNLFRFAVAASAVAERSKKEIARLQINAISRVSLSVPCAEFHVLIDGTIITINSLTSSRFFFLWTKFKCSYDFLLVYIGEWRVWKSACG